MAGRTTEDPRAAYRQAVRAVRAADQVAHGWDPATVDTRPSAVFREFGRLRWLAVPLTAAAFAVFVLVVSALAGVMR